MPPWWCFAASPGTRIQVFTRKAGTTDEEQLRETLPVGGWARSHEPEEGMAPLVPHPTNGTLVLFVVGERSEERRRELADRFHWVGDEVVRVVIFLPETVTTSVQGQVLVRPVQATS